MAVKDPKKTARILSILCIFIGLAALTVGILAVAITVGKDFLFF